MSLLHAMGAIALGASAAVQAAGEAPIRPAYLDHVEGSVVVAPAGDEEWIAARPARRLGRGDRLWTDKGSRAELRLRPGVLRIDGQTELALTRLQDRAIRVGMARGAMRVRLSQLSAGDDFQVLTPHLVFRALQPGDYRVDVDLPTGTTRVAVNAGAGMVHGDAGKTLQVRPGQQLRFRGSLLEQAPMPGLAFLDGLDQWTVERDRRQQNTAAADAATARPVAVPPEPARQPAAVAQQLPLPAAAPRQQPRPSDPELARRESWQREQQAVSEKWRREHELFIARQQSPQSTVMGSPGPGADTQQPGVPILRQGVPILRER